MQNGDKALSRNFGPNLGLIGPDLGPNCLQKLKKNSRRH